MFGAVHRAGHPGAVQNTLTAHLAVENRSLSSLLDGCDECFDAAPRFQPAFEGAQTQFGEVIDNF